MLFERKTRYDFCKNSNLKEFYEKTVIDRHHTLDGKAPIYHNSIFAKVVDFGRLPFFFFRSFPGADYLFSPKAYTFAVFVTYQ